MSIVILWDNLNALSLSLSLSLLVCCVSSAKKVVENWCMVGEFQCNDIFSLLLFWFLLIKRCLVPKKIEKNQTNIINNGGVRISILGTSLKEKLI